MKKPLRFVLIGVVSLLLLLALVVALALTPGVQTWAARKFAPATPELTMKAQLRAAPVPLHKLDPELPMTVVELVTECMQADPRLRLRSMSELVQRLEALGIPPWSQEQARRWWKEKRT